MILALTFRFRPVKKSLALPISPFSKAISGARLRNLGSVPFLTELRDQLSRRLRRNLLKSHTGASRPLWSPVPSRLRGGAQHCTCQGGKGGVRWGKPSGPLPCQASHRHSHHPQCPWPRRPGHLKTSSSNVTTGLNKWGQAPV